MEARPTSMPTLNPNNRLEAEPRKGRGTVQIYYRASSRRGFKRDRQEIWRFFLPLSEGHGGVSVSAGQRTQSSLIFSLYLSLSREFYRRRLKDCQPQYIEFLSQGNLMSFALYCGGDCKEFCFTPIDFLLNYCCCLFRLLLWCYATLCLVCCVGFFLVFCH